MRALALLLLGALLAGCVGPAERRLPAESVASASPVVARATPPASAIQFSPPALLGVKEEGAEPGVAVGPGDVVYVGAPGRSLYRSDDAGATWKGLGTEYCLDELQDWSRTSCPAASYDPGKDGAGDMSILVGPDGTLYHLGLAGLAGPVPFQTSTDKGESFAPAVDISGGVSADRQWLVRDGAGVLHATWRSADIVERSSLDGGASWSPLHHVEPAGGAGPMASDASGGTLYVAVDAGGTIVVAVSHDGGATWTDHAAASVPDDAYGFPIVAVDAAGTAYLVFSHDPRIPGGGWPGHPVGTPSVFVATSRDEGLHWSAPVAVSPPGVPAVFPWIVAGSAGRIAVAWYEGQLPTPGERVPNLWHVAVALSLDADQAAPAFEEVDASGGINHAGAICTWGIGCTASGGDRSMLDFFEMRLLSDGHPVLAFAGDTPAYQAFVSIYATRMVSGPSLYG
jgi:hypothetical protein